MGVVIDSITGLPREEEESVNGLDQQETWEIDSVTGLPVDPGKGPQTKFQEAFGRMAERRPTEYIAEELETFPDFGSAHDAEHMLEARAQKQSNWEQTLHGVGRLLGTTLTKTGTGIGFLAGLADPTNFGEDYISKASDNALAQLFEEAEESIKESLPIYKEGKYRHGNVFSQMGTLEFWMDDVVDGLAFMFSTYIPGGIAAKAGIGAKTAKALGQGIKTKKAIDKGSMFALMTSSEAMFEAKQVRDQVKGKLINEINPITGLPYTTDEATEIAAEKAKDTYLFNMIALAPSNLFETSFLFKKLPSSRGTKGLGFTGEEAVDLTKEYKGFAKLLDRPTMKALSGFGAGAVTEGLYEENIQFAVEHLNVDYGAKGETDTFSKVFSKLPGQMYKNLSDEEGQKAIALGSIIGGPAASRSSVLQGIQDKKNLNNAIKNINNRTGELTEIRNALKTEEVPTGEIDEETKEPITETRYVLDENNNPQFDEEKLANIIANRDKFMELEEIIDVLSENDSEKNKEIIKIIQDEKFSRWARSFFETGTSESLYERLDYYKDMKPEDMTLFGIDPSESSNASQIVEEYKKKAKSLEDLYNSIEYGILPEGSSADEIADFQARKNELFSIGARILSLKPRTNEAREKVSGLERLIGDEDAINEINELVYSYNAQKEYLEKLVAKSSSGGKIGGRKRKKIEEERKKLEELESQIKKAKEEINKGVPEGAPGRFQLNTEHVSRKEKGPEEQMLRMEGIRLGELKNASKSLSEEWRKLSDIKNGDKYFRESISDHLENSMRESLPESFPLKKDITSKEYKTYEKHKARNKTLKNKIENVKKDFFGYGIEERINRKEDTNKILDDIMSIRPNLPKNAVDWLLATVSNSKKYRDDLNKRVKFLKGEISAIEDEIANDAATENDINALPNLKKELKDKEFELIGYPSYERLNEMAEVFSELKEAKLPTEPNEVKLQIAEEYLKATKEIEQNSEQEDYSDTEEVTEQLEAVEKLKEIYDEREDMEKTPRFKKLMKAIEANIKSLKSILKIVESRKEDREKLQDDIKKDSDKVMFAQIGFNSETGEVTNQELFDLVKVLFNKKRGEGKFEEFMQEAKENEYEGVYSQIAIEDIRNNASDVGSEFTEIIDKELENIYNQMTSIPGVVDMKVTDEKTVQLMTGNELYKKNPDRLIEAFIRLLGNSIDDIKSDSAVRKYLREKNITEFKKNLRKEKRENSKITTDELISFINNHMLFSALSNMKKDINSPYRETNQITNEKHKAEEESAKDGGLFIPTNQQILSIREIIRFVLSSQKGEASEEFQAWAYLKGFAGTGKTKVVMAWVKKILGISGEDIYSVGHNKHSSLTISESLDTEQGDIEELIKALENNSNLVSDKKLIVIDEIGGLDDVTLNRLGEAIKNFNNKNRKDDHIKVITLGDPNQITTTASTPAIEGNIGITNGNNITNISPLTIVYRTGVSAITNISDMFKGHDREVKSAVTKANVPRESILSYLGELFGTASSSSNDSIITIINNRPESDRTRAVIVNTEADKIRYKVIEDKARILTVEEAQGQTIDEVYVDVYQGKQHLDTAHFNKYMYTATSRATSFLYVANLKNDDHIHDPEIIEKANNRQKEIDNAADKFLELKEKQVKIISDWSIDGVSVDTDTESKEQKKEAATKKTASPSKPKKPKKAPIVPTATKDDPSDPEGQKVEEVDSESMVDDKDSMSEDENTNIPPTTPTQETDKGLSHHKVQNPTSNAYKSRKRKDKPTIPGIAEGDDVYYVVDTYTDKEGKSKKRIRIVAEVEVDEELLYREVGVVGFDDLVNHPEGYEDLFKDDMRKIIETGENEFSNTFSSATNGLIKPKVPLAESKSVLAKGKIANGSRALKYNYGDTPNGQSLRDILSTFVTSIFKTGEKQSVLEYAIENSGLKIFTKEDVEKFNEKYGSKDGTRGVRPIPGIPYLVVETRATAKPQLIRMNPRKLNSVMDSELLKPIFKFISTISDLQSEINKQVGDTSFIYGDILFNEFITASDEYMPKLLEKVQKAHNVSITATKKINRLRKEAEDLVYEESSEKKLLPGVKVAKKNGDFLKKKKGVVQSDATGKAIKTTGKIISVSSDKKSVVVEVNGEKLNMKSSEVIVSATKNPGPAQRAFNRIARANFEVDNTILRVEKKADDRIISTGRSLLSTQEDYANSDKFENSSIGRQFLKRINKRLRRKKGVSEDYKFSEKDLTNEEINEFIAAKDKAMKIRFNIDDLNSMFAFDQKGNSSVSKGFGLRFPINKDHFNENQDTSVIESTFEGVEPTTTIIKFDEVKQAPKPPKSRPTAVPKPTPTPTAPTKRKPGKFTRNKPGRNLTKDKRSPHELGKLLNYKQAIAYAKKLIPGLTDEEISIINTSRMLKLGEGAELWGHFRDGMIYLLENPNGKGAYIKVIRHEIFHRIFGYHLSNEDRAKLIENARNNYPKLKNATEVEVEEFLAELYQDWINKGSAVSKFINKIFDRVLAFFNLYRTNIDNLDRFFEKIDNGYFQKPHPEKINTIRNKIRIKQHYGSTDVYREAKSTFIYSLNQYLNNTDSVEEENGILYNIPLTFREAVENIKLDMEIELEDIKEWLIVNRSFIGTEEYEQNAIEAAAMTALLQHKKATEEEKEEGIEDNYYVLNDLIEDNYPSLANDSYFISDEDTSLEDVSIKEHIEEGDQTNHERKITQQVKDFLSTIVKSDHSQVNPRFAYRAMLEIFDGIEFTGKGDLVKTIENNIDRFSNSEAMVALKERLTGVSGIITQAFDNEFNERTMDKNAKFHNFNNFIWNRRGDDISDMYLQNVDEKDANDQPINVLISRGNKSSADFFKEIHETTGMDYDLIKAFYIKYRAGNTLREIFSSVNSLREKNTMIGDYEHVTLYSKNEITQDVEKRSGFRLRYYKNRGSSQDEVIRGNIEEALVKVGTRRKKETFSEALANKANDATKVGADDKLRSDVIIDFLSSIGVINRTDSVYIPDTKLEILVSSIDGIIRGSNIIGKTETRKDEEGNDFDYEFTIKDVVANQNNNIANLIDVFNKVDEEARATSSIAGDGTRRFNFLNSSQAIDSLYKIMKGTDPRHFKSKFFERNIFKKAKNQINKIYEYTDHDSIKDREGKKDPILFKRELGSDWLERNINYGFLSMIKNYGSISKSTSNPLQYIQFSWTISDKPNTAGARVKVLGNKNLEKGIEQAILQEEERVEFSGNDKVKNHDENRKRSFLAGLKNIPYETRKQMDMPTKVGIVMKELEKQSEELVNVIVENGMRYDLDLSKAYNKLNNHELLDHKYSKPSIADWKNMTESEKERLRKEMLPIIDLFHKNNYVNGHFLNQIIMGDQAFYKTSKTEYNIIKRMSIGFAIGYRGLVHGIDGIGMKKKFRTAVGQDVKGVISEEEFGKFQKIVGEDYDLTDAQGFGLPERFEDIRRGFGESSNVGIITKPVHSEVDENGVPRKMKYSLVELTDNLVNEFPGLKALRKRMYEAEGGPVDEYLFESGFKVGAPAELAQDKEPIKAASVVTLSNYNWRIQFNPNHDSMANVATPSQMVYFIDTNGENPEQAAEVYEALAELMKTGKNRVMRSLGLYNGKSRVSKSTLRKVREMIAESMEGLDDRQHEFLTQVDENGEPLISLNFPTLVNKAITQFSSELSKKIVKIKFPGSKLVLQAAYGIEASRILKEAGLEAPRYRNEEGYAEMILPDIYKHLFTKGDTIFLDDNELDKVFGFRLPSTELHSGVPIKIIGFYPSKNNENIIIAPHQIVFFHGSDYDIDSLFVIRNEIAEEDFYDTNGNLIVRKEDSIGFDDKNNEKEINGKKFTKWIKDEIAEIGIFLQSINRETDIEVARSAARQRDVLEELYMKALKNKIKNVFMEVMVAQRNEEYMMAPISMHNFSGKQKKEGDTETAFEMLTRVQEMDSMEDLYEDRDLNSTLDQMKMHRDNFSGATLTGIFANAVKGIAYMFKSDKNNPAIAEKNHITIEYDKEGKTEKTVYDSFNRHHYKFKDENGNPVKETIIINGQEHNPSIWETLDSMINAAIDNVNEQILNVVNATSNTSDAYTAMVSMGIPLNTVVKFMTQPIMIEYSKAYRSFALVEARKIISDKIEKGFNIAEETKNMNLSDSNMEKYIGKNILEATWENDKDFIIAQYIILRELEKINSVGKAISDMSSFLSILKEFPVTFEEIQDKIDILNGIFAVEKGVYKREKGDPENTYKLKDDFPFKNVQILTIPHIREAWEALRMLKSQQQRIFHKNNQELVKFSEKIISSKAAEGRISLKLDKNTNKSLRLIRDEFIKYFISGITIDTAEGEYSMDTSVEPVYPANNDERKNPFRDSRNNREKELFGAEAWNFRFIQKVADMKEKHRTNRFLQHLRIRDSYKTGFPYVSFASSGAMEMEDMIDYMDDFSKISELEGSEEFTKFQYDFLKYAVLNQGLAFGSSNYTLLMPVEIFSEFNKVMDAKMQDMFDDASNKKTKEKLNNLLEHFYVQLMLNKADDLEGTYVRNRKETQVFDTVGGKKRYYGIDPVSGVVYDSKFKKGEKTEDGYENPYEGYPSIIVSFDDVLVKIKDLEEDPHVYYHRIGKKTHGQSYQFSEDVLELGYVMSKVIDSHTHVRTVPNPEAEVLTSKTKLKFKKGDKVRLVHSSDKARTNMKEHRVVSAITVKSNKWKKTVEAEIKETEEKVNKAKGQRRTRLESILRDLKNALNTKRDIYKLEKISDVDYSKDIEKEKPQEQRASRKSSISDIALTKILTTLAKRTGLEYEIINDKKSRWAGKFQGRKIVINTAYAKADTAFHEFTHPFIKELKKKNKLLYKNLTNQIENTQEGQRILNMVKNKYPELSYEDQVEEAIVHAIGEHASDNIDPQTGKKLISAIERFLKWMKAKIEDIFGKGPIESEKLDPNMTLEQLGVIMALSDNDIVISEIPRSEAQVFKYFRDLGITNVHNIVKPNKYNDAVKAVSKVNAKYPGLMNVDYIGYDKGNKKLHKVAFNANYQKVESEKEKTEKEKVDWLDRIQKQAEDAGIFLNEKDPDNTFYQARNLGNRIFKRLTEFIGDPKEGKFSATGITEDDMAKKIASSMFIKNRTSEDSKIIVDDKELSYNELVVEIKKRFETQRVYGKMAHLILEYNISGNSEIAQQIEDYFDAKDGSHYELNRHSFGWIYDNTNAIYKKANINLDPEGKHEPSERDRVLAEQILFSEIMGIATKADTIVQHPNGDLSIKDWKAGTKFLSDIDTQKMLKYADGLIDINGANSKVNKAKLEVMLRAMIIKESNQEARFRDLTVVHVNRQSLADNYEVEVEPFIEMIKLYYKNEDKEAYEKLNAKQLFDYRTYGGVDASLKNELSDEADMEINERIKSKQTRLNYLHARYTLKERAENSSINRKMAELSMQIAQLKSAPGSKLDSDKIDMGMFKRLFGSIYDVNNPIVKAFGKVLFDRKTLARMEIARLEAEHDEKFMDVLKEYYDKHGIKYTLNQLTKGYVNGVNYQDVFGFMWEEKNKDTGLAGMYAVTEKSTKWKNGSMTKAQKEYSAWYRDTINRVYQETMGEVAYIDDNNVAVTKAQQLGSGVYPNVLPADFMPRVPMNFEEASERKGVFSKETWEMTKAKYLSNFIEKEFHGNPHAATNTNKGVAVKFMETEKTIGSEMYTMSTEIAFKDFISGMVMKKHMDDVLSLGEGLAIHLKTPREDGTILKESAEFIEDHLMLHVLNKRKEINISRKPRKVKVKGEYYQLSDDKILRSMKDWVSASSMWLKPVAGTFNTILISILNNKDAIKGSVAKQFGIDPRDIDFTMRDLTMAHKEYTKLTRDFMVGDYKKNKLWILANKFDYLTDNYDYRVRKGELMAPKNKILDQSNLYLFHTIGEDYGTLTLMAAQLNHMKVKLKDGKEISIWDAYDDNGNWRDEVGTRGKVQRHDETFEDLKELTSEEITKLKRVSQRIHGGYRQDERTAMELHVFGQWVLQFKKYMPAILNNLFQGKYKDTSLGAYKIKRDPITNAPIKFEGENVYEWIERVNEGRMVLMFNMMMTYAKMSEDPNYRWENLSNEQKQHLYEMLVTTAMYVSMLVARGAIFDDDDEDKAIYMRFSRFAEDITQGYNPLDLLRNFQAQTVVLPRAFKATEAFFDFMWDGVIEGKRNNYGELPGERMLKKVIPPFSIISEIDRYFSDKPGGLKWYEYGDKRK